MEGHRGRQGLRPKTALQRRRDLWAVAFTLFMGAALLAVGYLWVEAQEDRRSLGVFTTGPPPS